MELNRRRVRRRQQLDAKLACRSIADGIPDSNDTSTFDRGNVTLYPVFFGNLLVPNSDIHPTVDKVVIGNNPLSFVGLYGSTLTVDSTNITETARGVVIGSGAGDVAALTSTLATFDTQYATLGSAAGSSGTLNLTSASAGAFSVSGTGAVYDLIVGRLRHGHDQRHQWPRHRRWPTTRYSARTRPASAA